MDGKRLEVEVDGSPTPSVQWFKNGQEVKEEFSDGHKHALVVSPSDSSSNYSIIVKSGKSTLPVSNDEVSGNVVIRSDPVLKDVTVHLNSEVILTVNTSEYNKSDITWSKEPAPQSTAETRTASYKLQVTQTSEASVAPPAAPKEPVVKPKIKVGLSNVSALQNQKDTTLTVETETIISEINSSSEKRTVKWFVDDIEIVEIDTRYKIVTEETSGTYKLIVKEANEGTAGIYKCKIANEAGYDETSAEFTVSSKPEFMQELEDREAMEGETISMDVVIAGNPKPDIQWLRDGVDVSSDKSILIEKESDTVYILTIEKVTSNSVGTYECVIKNRVGYTKSKGILSLLTEPSFSKDLGEITSGKVGEDVALEVVIEGNPRPVVTWYKNGNPISTTVVSENTDNNFRLRFEPVELEDAAEYYCTAKNRIGEKTSRKIRFTVETEEKVYEKPEVKKPTLLRGLSDTSVSPNDTLVLKVTAEGTPEPSVTWCKDGTPIGTIGPDGALTGTPPDNVSIAKDGTTHTLTVKNVSPADAAAYSCNIKNDAGETSSAAQVTVTEGVQKPIITGLSDAVGIVGADLKLEVTVDGAPAPTVTWLKDGKEMDKGSQVSDGNTHKLLLSNLKDTDAGTYTCRATNSSGDTDSVAKVSVTPTVSKPEFMKELKDCEVKEGNPIPEIQWLRNGVDVSSDKSISIKKESDTVYILTIEKVSSNNVGTYECAIKNRVGEARSKVLLSLLTEPSFTKDLGEITSGKVGELVTLEVGTEGNPKPVVTWYKDGTAISTTESTANSSRLRLEGVKLEDAGEYYCTAKNRIGEKTSRKIRFTVEKVDEKPEAKKPTLLRGLSNTSVSPNDTLVLKVTADGSPEPSVTWCKDGVPLGTIGPDGNLTGTLPANVSITKDGTTHTLTVKNVSAADAAAYTCTIKNDAGETSSASQVSVTERDQKPVISGLSDAVGIIGGDLKLEVTVVGSPAPTVTWFKDGQEIDKRSQVSDGNSHQLLFSNLKPSDEGTYTCRAKNSSGETDSVAKITVATTAPQFIDELPSNIKLIEGNMLVLQAKVSGSPLPKVKWMKDGVEMVMDSRMENVMRPDGTVILTIREVNISDQGAYELIVINSQGQVSNHSSVTVAARDVLPKFVKELTRAEVEIGQSAKMEAKVIGTPSPEIKWYKDDIAIKTNERIRTKRADDGTLTVEIDNVTEEDLGLYKVLASNSAGEKITIAALRTPRHELPTKPEFVVHLLDGDFEEDSQLVLTCKVRGSPDPVIKWLRDGEELIPDGDRIKSTMDEDGHINLTIEDIRMDESGKYVCSAMNSEGRTRTAAQVNTFKKRPGSQRDKTPKKPVEERRSKFQPSDFEIPDRVMPDRDPIHVSSESHYQQGPDTMLLQYRDPDYPLRVREYLRVGARESPYLANNLRSSYWGDADIGYGFSPQVAVRERRRFSAIVKEIQTEVTTGEAPSRGRRFFSPHHPELSSSSEYARSSSATRTGASSSSFLSSSSTLTNSSHYRSTTSSSPFKYSRS